MIFFPIHLVVSARPLGLLYDGSKGVGEVFEQEVLLLNVHAQDPVEELAHLVVSLVQGQHPGAVLTGGDQTNSNKAISDIWERNSNQTINFVVLPIVINNIFCMMGHNQNHVFRSLADTHHYPLTTPGDFIIILSRFTTFQQMTH